MRASRPSVLLWDWDNTLVDAWMGVAAALNVVFAAHAMPPWSLERTRAEARFSLRDSFPPMFGESWPEAARMFRTAMAEGHLAHLQPMSGALDMLEAGSAWPQGVVSNKDGAFLRREVAHLRLHPLFRAVVGAGDADADKPAPDPIWYALEPIGVPPSAEIWYIGDTAVDMQAARAAGCTAVLLGNAAHDGGLARLTECGSAPDLHFATAEGLATRLRALA
jgi:phosphoglycolate phosphatase